MRNRTRAVIFVIVTVIIYNEYVCYFTKSWFHWPIIHCSSSECLRILLVADPQILGEQYETGFPKGFLSRWDSDRYLYKTFKLAMAHVEPHIVVFLGDIMDEGSVAKRDQYERYVERFFYIFKADFNKFVYLPGDNDIGGEDEPFSSEKLQTFQNYFNQRDTIVFNHTYLFKVNRIAFLVPKPLQALHSERNKIRIVLSHLPLLNSYSTFVHQVLHQIQPHIIFSAHGHKSLHIRSSESEKVIENLLQGENKINYFSLNNSMLHEIVVPTCSYRMGVSNMGYGMAVIDTKNYGLYYSVLWLPSRFLHLFLYVALLLILLIMFIITLCWGISIKLIYRYIRKSLIAAYIL